MSVYNAEKYIGKCIRSILNQTFGDFECIVIDDASNDSTYKMLTSFHDNRLKIIRNDDNLGLTKNLNYAIKISQVSMLPEWMEMTFVAVTDYKCSMIS